MNFIAHKIGGDASPFSDKIEIQTRHWKMSRGLFCLNQVKRSNFGAYIISITYVSHAELRIGCLVMFRTSYDMGKYQLTNIS